MLVIGGEDGSIKIWDVRSSAGYQRDYNIGISVNAVTLHPNQVDIICGDEDGYIRVYDLQANKSIYTYNLSSHTLQSHHRTSSTAGTGTGVAGVVGSSMGVASSS